MVMPTSIVDGEAPMTSTTTSAEESRPAATAARIYDYILGGTHNFPADRAAAEALVQAAPFAPAVARANRAFLGRAVRYLTEAGIRQFVDIGSGIPTVGNVHEVTAPDARVVYVDIDPVAVAESLEILQDRPGATAIRADVRHPDAILDHPDVRRLISFDEPVGLLMVTVLHFVADDAEAYAAVDRLTGALCTGSHLVISHGSIPPQVALPANVEATQEVYRSRTATPVRGRTEAEVGRFFAGFELVEPGLVWVPAWRPASGDPTDFADDPAGSAVLGGVGRRP
jgi:hypothetical protein